MGPTVKALSFEVLPTVSRLSKARLQTKSLRINTRSATQPIVAPRSFSTKTQTRPFSRTYAAAQKNANVSIGTELEGESGRSYTIEKILQEREKPLSSVYLARGSDDKKHILKDLPKGNYQYQLGLQKPLAECQHLRSVRDCIPGHSMFVYDHLDDVLLQVAYKNISMDTRKRILRDALRGIAELHERDIVHADIKANNILVDFTEGANGTTNVNQVKIFDLEDATHVPRNSVIRGTMYGNELWRSPESHSRGRIQKYSDIFSFGIVCIFTVLQRVIFWVDRQDLAPNTDTMSAIMQRQISYFGEGDSFENFLGFLGQDKNNRAITETWKNIRRGFNENQPRLPFRLWRNERLDADFKDLVLRMTDFDPAKRITARDALDHPWFSGI